MLQFNQGKKTKKIEDLREQAENGFIKQLDMAVKSVDLPKHANDYHTNQGNITKKKKKKKS